MKLRSLVPDRYGGVDIVNTGMSTSTKLTMAGLGGSMTTRMTSKGSTGSVC